MSDKYHIRSPCCKDLFNELIQKEMTEYGNRV